MDIGDYVNSILIGDDIIDIIHFTCLAGEY